MDLEAVDPEQAVLLVHFVCNIPKPILVLTEHLGDTGNGAYMMDLVDRSHQAATTAADTAGFQFQGNSSSRRWTGWLFILKQGANGIPVTDICRKAGISQATYFNWKKKYDGLLPTEMRRLKLKFPVACSRRGAALHRYSTV